MQATLKASGAVFYEWSPKAMADHDTLAEEEVLVRLVTSFQTHPDEVTAFIENAIA